MEVSDFNLFASDYNSKRKKPWRPLKIFLDHLKNNNFSFNDVILDLGCANARNFKIIGDFPKKVVGIDVSLELIKIAQRNLKDFNQYSPAESKFYQVLRGDITFLPFRHDSAQIIFSVASMHHIKGKANRKNLISQISEILKKNGTLIITVWRKWQKKFRLYFIIDFLKRKLNPKYKQQQKKIGLAEFGDKLVPWNISGGEVTYLRYYHFFTKREIKNILKSYTIKHITIMGGPTKRDNFFIFACKNKI